MMTPAEWRARMSALEGRACSAGPDEIEVLIFGDPEASRKNPPSTFMPIIPTTQPAAEEYAEHQRAALEWARQEAARPPTRMVIKVNRADRD
jgi:hypothetical protein